MPSRKTAITVDIDRVLEVFTRGFAYGRSFTHPYNVDRIEGMWVTRDAPRKNPREYRREEWFAFDIAPPAVDRIARNFTRGSFAICAICQIDDDEQVLRSAYKALGYRLSSTEPIFIHHLRRIPRLSTNVAMERVATVDRANELSKVSGKRQISDEDLSSDATVRQYVALDGSQIVGWGKSVGVGQMSWCADLHVQPSHRRRGIGGALMSRLLRDDRRRGISANVLAASHTGAMLYPTLGYEQIAVLLLYTPIKRLD